MRFSTPKVDTFSQLWIRYRNLHSRSKLCVSAQRYYEHYSFSTLVLAASFTSTREIMALAGLHHMTIPAPLLEELSSTASDSAHAIPNLFENTKAVSEAPPARLRLADDEPAFRLAFTQSNNGKSIPKLAQVGLLHAFQTSKIRGMEGS